jgi:hypothetical protein
MFMRFRGGGIGHLVSREWDSFLQSDGHVTDEGKPEVGKEENKGGRGGERRGMEMRTREMRMTMRMTRLTRMTMRTKKRTRRTRMKRTRTRTRIGCWLMMGKSWTMTSMHRKGTVLSNICST